jgi:hypothetical protein
MKRLLLMLLFLPFLSHGQGVYASLDGAMSELQANGTITVGYSTKGLHAGIGTGMSRVTFQNDFLKSYGLYHPVFVELAYLIPSRKVSPFVSLRGGMLLNSRNGVFNSPVNIDGSYTAGCKGGLAFRRTNFYFVPFLQYSIQDFDKDGSRNVGVTSRIKGIGAGVNLIFY